MSWLFINGGFIAAGAAAVSLPIWIHLMLRQRARPLEIGSVRFLQRVVRRTKRRQRLRRWLLLALRCAAMLLLGLLFARPYLPDAPADGHTREAVVLIDRSASMRAAREDENSAFQDALEQAQGYVEGLGEQARVHFAVFDQAGVEPLSAEELDELESPSFAATDYGEAISWATDLLASSPRTHRSLLLATDLQASGITAGRSASFPSDVPVEIVNTGVSVSQNVAIESATPLQVELRPGSPVSLAVRVLNAGALPVADLPLRLTLKGPGGKIEQQQSCSISSGSRTTVRFELPIEQPALYQGEVVAAYTDAFAYDDRRFVAFQVRHPDRVLLVDGDSGRTHWESETYFLETALRLTTPVGDGPARTFEVERLVWDRGEGFPDLAGFRLIILTNLGRFSDVDAARLTEFTQAGGSVLMFAGDRTTAAVLAPLQRAGVLPESTIASPRDLAVRVSSFDQDHPALAIFADPGQGDLRRLTVKRLLPMTNLPSDDRVLLQASDWPLICERAVGDGQFLFVATTADRAWHDWPQSRLYVPLFRQIAAYLTGQLNPRQAVRDEIVREPTASPGIESNGEALVVRNIDPRESLLQRLTAQQFRQALQLPEATDSPAEKITATLAPKTTSRSDEHWPTVVLLLLSVLAAETLLSSRVNA